MEPGWYQLKRWRSNEARTAVHHYSEWGTYWRSRCGARTIPVEDQPDMVLMQLGEMFTTQPCTNCIRLLESDKRKKDFDENFASDDDGMARY